MTLALLKTWPVELKGHLDHYITNFLKEIGRNNLVANNPSHFVNQLSLFLEVPIPITIGSLAEEELLHHRSLMTNFGWWFTAPMFLFSKWRLTSPRVQTNSVNSQSNWSRSCGLPSMRIKLNRWVWNTRWGKSLCRAKNTHKCTLQKNRWEKPSE